MVAFSSMGGLTNADYLNRIEGYANTTGSNYVRVMDYEKEKTVGSNTIGDIPQYPGDSLAESLFTINPKLRRKYKGDKRRLQADIMFAATQKLQTEAATKLAKLLGGE